MTQLADQPNAMQATFGAQPTHVNRCVKQWIDECVAMIRENRATWLAAQMAK